MEQHKKIMVYFNNGNRAAFEVDKVVFVKANPGEGVFSFDDTPDKTMSTYRDLLACGSLVNWNSVAFVREWEERSALDEL
ncbi:MAG: hypothetical protein IKE76_04480 [Clostridia bacterium]|nr:hypothetical protein [Clostridia bacterium]